MKLKERLNLRNQSKIDNSVLNANNTNDVDYSPLFIRNVLVEQVLKSSLLKNKNIILLSPIEIDKTSIANYVRGFVSGDTSVEILNDFSYDFQNARSEKLFVPNPSIKDVTKILELILFDYKNFIFCLNLKTFDNVLESLRTILALNNSNLTSNNIEHLIGVAAPVLVYFDRNEDGLFEVTNVAKVLYRNNIAFLDVLYSDKNSEVEELVEKIEESQQIFSNEVVEQNIDDVEMEADVDTDSNLDVETEVKVVETPVEKTEPQIVEPVVDETLDIQMFDESVEEKPVEENTTAKVNKYKLLKEKVKSRRQ